MHIKFHNTMVDNIISIAVIRKYELIGRLKSDAVIKLANKTYMSCV